ncbi:MAG: histidine kinase [Bacteroidetes bacterium]|nr:histidine kinase [Bacteroidota bacterium]MBU1373072.1 histidine kinase [Bacteroidota bacterium]MBU1484253.1 histidine kinase [Bacteroidota bacterium]MBU1759954.1 histidine kinase [Bacteroidota bacterium]MBU2268223.1 histidine kinase [Bacteroidota bacterium]
MNRLRKFLLHTMVWIFLITIFTFAASAGFNSTQGFYFLFVGLSLFNLCIFYINLYFIIPITLDKRRFFLWMLSCLILIATFLAIKYGFSFYIYKLSGLKLMVKDREMSFSEPLNFMLGTFMTNGFIVFLSTAYKFTVDWFFNEREKSDLEKQSLTAELAFLKSQINPHFLFNSLNNIYSLAYQKSEETPNAILKLSEIMRYMLYESNDNRVAIEKEITYLKSFIELQKLRFKGNSYVVLEVEGNISNQQIVPLILISFVENAFKHGLASDKKNPIYINISVFEDNLLFTVKNKKNNVNKDQTGGIGMVNVKRRLELTYPEKYKLSIENHEHDYYCELYLNL